MKIAFAGLGVMGGPMARHLVGAGHDVTGFNRTVAKAEAWAAATGGKAAATVAEAARGVDLFILCVGNDEDVRAVVTEALPHLSEAAVIVDHTTTSAKVAREMAELANGQGRSFIDAPVSGGIGGASAGTLTFPAGTTELVIPVTLLQDGLDDEDSEDFFVNLGTVGPVGAATVLDAWYSLPPSAQLLPVATSE